MLKWFVETVNKVVIDDSLVCELADSILSPKMVRYMSDEEVMTIASEPEERAEARRKLQQEIKEADEVIDALTVAD